MPNILVLHSSPRASSVSVTRRLTARVLDRLRDAYRDVAIVEHDLAAGPPDHVGQEFLAAVRLEPQSRSPAQADLMQYSETLIAEVVAADMLVIGAPMYNFGLTTPLKAWLDWISVPGVTFRYRANGLAEGLLGGRPAIIVTSRGGDYRPGALHSGNFAEPHLMAALGLLGFDHFEIVAANWQSLYPEARREGFIAAEREIANLSLPLLPADRANKSLDLNHA